MKPLDAELLTDLFKTLDYGELFNTLRYDLENNYNCEIKWHRNGTIDINNVTNQVVQRFLYKIGGFFTWYVHTQNIMTEDLKVPVRQPYIDKIKSGKQEAKKLYSRVNEIVDKEIDFHSLRIMANV